MFPPLSCSNLMNRSPGVRSVSLWLLFSEKQWLPVTECFFMFIKLQSIPSFMGLLVHQKMCFLAFESIYFKKINKKKVFCIVGFLKTACLLLCKICMSECTETLTWLWSFPSFIIFMRPWTGIMERGCSERKKKGGNWQGGKERVKKRLAGRQT